MLRIMQFYDFHHINVITGNFVKRLWRLWQSNRIYLLNLNSMQRWPMARATVIIWLCNVARSISREKKSEIFCVILEMSGASNIFGGKLTE